MGQLARPARRRPGRPRGGPGGAAPGAGGQERRSTAVAASPLRAARRRRANRAAPCRRGAGRRCGRAPRPRRGRARPRGAAGRAADAHPREAGSELCGSSHEVRPSTWQAVTVSSRRTSRSGRAKPSKPRRMPARERPPRAAGQAEQDGLGLVVEGVAEQHDGGVEPLGDLLQDGVPRLPGGGLRTDARWRRRSRAVSRLVGAHRGHLRDDARRRARPSRPGARGRRSRRRPAASACGPRRPWPRAARASRRRRCRRPRHGRAAVERGRARRAHLGVRPRAAGWRRHRTRVIQASGSPISDLDGRFSGPAQTALNSLHADLVDDVAHERGAVAVLRHLGVQPEQPAQDAVEGADALAALVERLADLVDRRDHGRADAVHHDVGVALEQRHHAGDPVEDLALLGRARSRRSGCRRRRGRPRRCAREAVLGERGGLDGVGRAPSSRRRGGRASTARP